MKNKSDTFRTLKEIECKIINNSLSSIVGNVTSKITNMGFKFYLSLPSQKSNLKYPVVHIIPEQLIFFVHKINTIKHINMAGIYFGFIKKSIFFISLEGAEFLYKNQLLKEYNIILVNRKGEQSVLYGNPIKKNMISEVKFSEKEMDFTLILNKDDEMIAVAQLLIKANTYERAKNENIIAQIWTDKGYYIRQENKKK